MRDRLDSAGQAYVRRLMLRTAVPAVLTFPLLLTLEHPASTATANIVGFAERLVGFGVIYLPIQYWMFRRLWIKRSPR